MSSSLRRGALAAAAIAFSIASLSACAAGNNAQTLEVKPDNAATTVGDIKIQNAVVITQPDEEPTGPAVISVTLFNTGNTAQTLDAIALPGTGRTAALKPAKGKNLSIPAGGSLILGGADNASAVLADSSEAVKDGDAQKVTFTFSQTGDVSLQAFVVPSESFFSGWGPSEVPAAPSASEQPRESATGTPTATATGTGTGTPTGTPTDEASASATATESGATGATADESASLEAAAGQ